MRWEDGTTPLRSKVAVRPGDADERRVIRSFCGLPYPSWDCGASQSEEKPMRPKLELTVTVELKVNLASVIWSLALIGLMLR